MPFTPEHPLLFSSRRTRSLSRCVSLAQLTSPPRKGPAFQPGPAGGRGTRAECMTRPPGGPASPLPHVRPDSEWESEGCPRGETTGQRVPASAHEPVGEGRPLDGASGASAPSCVRSDLPPAAWSEWRATWAGGCDLAGAASLGLRPQRGGLPCRLTVQVGTHGGTSPRNGVSPLEKAPSGREQTRLALSDDFHLNRSSV